MITRRKFLKTFLVSLLAAPALLKNVFAASALPAGEAETPETDPVAMALGYKKDAKNVDFTKYPNRKKPENQGQFCKNCALYTAKNDSWGKCQLLQKGLVSSQGWCGSWSKKS